MAQQTAFERTYLPATSTPDTRAHLICSLDGGFYGIDVHKVRQVGVLGKIWRLPGVPAFVKGVTRVRDLLIPLVDLRCKLGLPEANYHRHTVVVVADLSPPIAVVVDAVERVARFDVRDIQPIGQVGEKAESRAVTGFVNWEDRPCLLLDIEWILLGDSRAKCEERGADDVEPAGLSQSEESTASPDNPTVGIAEATVSPAIVAGTLPPGKNIGDGFVFPRRHGERPCPGFREEDLHRAAPVLRIMDPSTAVGNARLFDLLARPAWVGSRRVPGFRSGEPRLFALAEALLQMPATFQTKDANPVVAALLGCSLNDYRITQFRYDLNKFRARHLAERIGRTRRYRLTGVGRAVCEAVRRQVATARATTVRADRLQPSRSLGLSA
ncbi:MAG: purine-binding chemotaxis protein CheW [Planctomycetes bacterium]|nr:purine-binding chemotaxis protein CheW [Planctomycetota bacterium]